MSAKKRNIIILFIFIIVTGLWAQGNIPWLTTFVKNHKVSQATAAEEPNLADPEVSISKIPDSVNPHWIVRRIWDIHKVMPPHFKHDFTSLVVGEERYSLWFQADVSIEDQDYRLFVTQVEPIDEYGQLISDHSQEVKIGAALYEVTESHLNLILSTERLGGHGSYGELPEVKTPQWLDIGPGKKALLLENTQCDQGICQTFGNLLEVSTERLAHLGTFVLAEENLAQCDEKTKGSCFSYHGKIEFISDGSKDYFDFVVKKTGQEKDENGQLISPHDIMVTYQGDQYKEMKF